MTGVTLPAWDPQAALLIVIVLVESVVLYVGYGGLERLVGPRLMRALIGRDDTA